jgi:two-component system response regulator DegU
MAPNPFGLTDREYEVVNLVMEGHKNLSIAYQLDISIKTVKNHLSSAFKKAGVNNRSRLALKVWHLTEENKTG